MAPKEKAEELVDKFKSIEIEVHQKYMGYGESCSYIQMQDFDAKECALIAVDEIIKNIISIPTNYGASWTYWMQVKQEIEKL